MNFFSWLENTDISSYFRSGFYPVVFNGKQEIAYYNEKTGDWKTFFNEKENYNTNEFTKIGSMIKFKPVGKQFIPKKFYQVKINGKWTIGYYDPSFDENKPWTIFFQPHTKLSADAFERVGLLIEPEKMI